MGSSLVFCFIQNLCYPQTFGSYISLIFGILLVVMYFYKNSGLIILDLCVFVIPIPLFFYYFDNMIQLHRVSYLSTEFSFLDYSSF